MKKLVNVLSVCILLVVILYISILKKNSDNHISNNEYTIAKRDLCQVVNLCGQCEYAEKKDIINNYPELEIRAVYIQIGDYISKGDTVFLYDERFINECINAIEKRNSSNNTNVLDVVEKYDKLGNREKQEYLKSLKTLYENPQIKSEYEGVILEVDIQTHSGQEKLIVGKVGCGEKVVVRANDEEISKISCGMEASILFCNGTYTLQGKVKKVGSYRYPDGYKVDIDVLNEEKWYLGEEVEVRIFLKKKEEVLCVPYYYIHKNSKGLYILINGDKVFIEKGEEDGYWVEVKSEEVKIGDIVE